MYSNNRPFREGALLYKEEEALEQIALLYQRYRRFDESSYTAANATYFHLQGLSALRLGRYSIPLDGQVSLAIQRPISSSTMKTYLNTPNPLKWAANSLLQRSRMSNIRFSDWIAEEKETAMIKGTESRASNRNRNDGTSLFKQAVLNIEYAQFSGQDSSKSRPARSIAIDTNFLGIAAKDFTVSTSYGIQVPMDTANSQFFVEALIQCILNQNVNANLSDKESKPMQNHRVLVGGFRDTPINQLASEIIQRMTASFGCTDVALLEFDECDIRYVTLNFLFLPILRPQPQCNISPPSFVSSVRLIVSLPKAELLPKIRYVSFLLLIAIVEVSRVTLV